MILLAALPAVAVAILVVGLLQSGRLGVVGALALAVAAGSLAAGAERIAGHRTITSDVISGLFVGVPLAIWAARGYVKLCRTLEVAPRRAVRACRVPGAVDQTAH
jgi:hypothetical protein